MTDQSPITPPPELVQQWEEQWCNMPGERGSFIHSYMAAQAAQWGADQELEACCSEMDGWGDIQYSAGYKFSKKLRWHRRPKPPTLKEKALAVIENSAICDHLSLLDEAILRRALEALDD